MITGTVLVVVLAATPLAQPVPTKPTDRDNVKRGLKWLAAQQRANGSWTGMNSLYTVYSTAYSGLALLMEGSTPGAGEYSANIAGAVAWFEKIAQPNGLLVPAEDSTEQSRYMQSHAAALLFLVSAYETDDDPERRKRLAKLLERAVKFAADGQSSRGGWGFVEPRAGNDLSESSTTSVMLQALFAADRSGIAVPRTVFDKVAKYYSAATNASGGLVYGLGPAFAPRGTNAQPYQSAEAAAVAAPHDRKPTELAGWVDFASNSAPNLPREGQSAQPSSINATTLQQYLAYARLANALGESGHRTLSAKRADATLLRWSSFRDPLYRLLRAAQAADGSWPDRVIGTPYSTSLALIVLQLDNNYLTAFSR